MLTIEEYIAKRKKEDNINEMIYESRMENMKIIVNYVFEYFNNYLDTSEINEQTVLNNERLNNYRKQLQHYSTEVQDWLIDIYEEYDKKINASMANYLKKDDFFLLYDSDSEFRSVSYDCYAHLIKKNPFLKNQTEMLYVFIREHHQVLSQPTKEFGKLSITDEIKEWIDMTWEKYHVNVLTFAYNWVEKFHSNEELWTAKHKRKSQEGSRKYEYDIKQKNNLFNLNLLYRRMPKKPYTRGKKQEFEILMMYYWLHQLDGDDEGYWDEYISKIIN